MARKIIGLFLVLFLSVTGLVFAEGTDAVQLALWSPVQLFPASDSIKGLRLDLLYTANQDVSGVTFGIGWAETRGDMKGVSVGAVNWTEGASYGLKAGLINYVRQDSAGLDIGVLNVVRGDNSGVQLGTINWNKGFFHGFQLGAVNEVRRSYVGFQCGLINYAEEINGVQAGFFNTTHSGTMKGFQLGAINYAAEVSGLQLGIFNITDSLNGLQIGLANYNGGKDPLPFMVLVNGSF